MTKTSKWSIITTISHWRLGLYLLSLNFFYSKAIRFGNLNAQNFIYSEIQVSQKRPATEVKCSKYKLLRRKCSYNHQCYTYRKIVPAILTENCLQKGYISSHKVEIKSKVKKLRSVFFLVINIIKRRNFRGQSNALMST